jgi:hypothetical protein
MNDNFIFNPLNKQHTQINTQYFCLSKDADFIDNEGNGQTTKEHSNTLAKAINQDNSIFYQIKTASNNQLFNPFSKFDREKSYSFLDNVVRPVDKFINVNKNVLTYYLKFLLTQNTAWLTKAERERL